MEVTFLPTRPAALWSLVMKYEVVSPDQIKVPTDNSHLRIEADVNDLIDSIQTIGRIINPLIVTADLFLVAGARRLNAAKKLNLKEIPVLILEAESVDQELMSIDENLARRDLSDIERDHALLRRKVLYEVKFPKTKKGHAGARARHKDANEDSSVAQPSFSATAASIIGCTPRAIEQSIKRVTGASELIQAAWSEGKLKTSQVDELLKLSRQDQDTICEQVKEKSLAETKMAISELHSDEVPRQGLFGEDEDVKAASLKRFFKKKQIAMNAARELVAVLSRIPEARSEAIVALEAFQIEFSKLIEHVKAMGRD